MKLIRFGEAGRERPGVLLDDGSRLDVSDFVSDYDEAFFARGGMDALRDWLKTHFSPASRVPSTVRTWPDTSCTNDYSERSFQLERGGQWVKGKSADTFAPLGPFLASPDEFPDPSNLKMWLKVNGEIRQNSSTANMIFDVATLLSYVSEFMTLLPGDVISTGTPAGVGLGMKPPQYLKSGDVVELGIDGLGESRQRVVNFSEQRYSQTV